MRLLMLLAMASVLSAQTPAAAPSGNAQNGKKLFETIGCWQCHGHEGQGGAGARIAPRPIAFPAFQKYVRAPADQMPPYTAKVVSDQDLADIYAYLQSIKAPPAAKSIPILNH